MNGGDIKDEIENRISYANAPSYTIRVDYPKGRGVVRSPAGGEASKKVTDKFTVNFDPSIDWDFIKWRVLDSSTRTEITDENYLSFASITDSETECTFVKAPAEGSDLIIEPVLVARPQIISYSPLYDAEGVLKDTSIQVMFDKDMDESSIYYSEDEIDALDYDSLLPEDAVIGESKIYGYKKDGEIFYKNIAISNSSTGENLFQYFNAPVFDNPKLLSITTSKVNPLPAWTQLLVSLEPGFFYKVGEKDVCMPLGKKWLYLASNETDTTPPIVNSCTLALSNGTSMPVYTGNSFPTNTPWNSSYIPYNNDKKLKINLEVKDAGSGPTGSFTITIQKVRTYERSLTTVSGEEKSKGVNYQSVRGQTATFDGTVDISDLVIGDGVYSVKLLMSDKSGKSVTKQYYFNIDTTAPKVNYFYCSSTTECSLGVDWKGYNQNGDALASFYDQYWVSCDLKQTTIKYRKKGTSTWNTKTVTGTVVNATIDGLQAATEYEFNVTHEDYNGNTKTQNATYETSYKAPYPSNFKITSKSGKKITFGWTAPSTDFDNYVLYYYIQDQNFNILKQESVNIGKTSSSYTVDYSSCSGAVYIYAYIYTVKKINGTVYTSYDGGQPNINELL